VVIAQALVCRPALVLADEPTASLDSTTQAELRALLATLQGRFGIALLLVSHDLGALSGLARTVHVMYAGAWWRRERRSRCSVIPSIPTRAACCGPSRAFPPRPPPGSGWRSCRSRGLRPIRATCQGDVLSNPVARTGCPRAPSDLPRRPGRQRGALFAASSIEAEEPLIRARGLTKRYTRPGGRRGGGTVLAVADVDLTIARGTDLALVGESGSGKSTLARCLARLEEPTGGELWFEGADILALHGRRLRPFRERVQLILQDSATALDPRLRAADIISEPLQVLGRGNRRQRRRRALELMEAVGLPAACADRRPLELSGGQRQRLAIARALAVQPRLLILDEAFTGLDVSIQAQIVSLLQDLRRRHGLTYLYISHDLPLMARLADEMAIMFQGRIVEHGRAPSPPPAARAPRRAAPVGSSGGTHGRSRG
jgi:peptide/nickel transport system ATP-binding protein